MCDGGWGCTVGGYDKRKQGKGEKAVWSLAGWIIRTVGDVSSRLGGVIHEGGVVW